MGDINLKILFILLTMLSLSAAADTTNIVYNKEKGCYGYYTNPISIPVPMVTWGGYFMIDTAALHQDVRNSIFVEESTSMKINRIILEILEKIIPFLVPVFVILTVLFFIWVICESKGYLSRNISFIDTKKSRSDGLYITRDLPEQE